MPNPHRLGLRPPSWPTTIIATTPFLHPFTQYAWKRKLLKQLLLDTGFTKAKEAIGIIVVWIKVIQRCTRNQIYWENFFRELNFPWKFPQLLGPTVFLLSPFIPHLRWSPKCVIEYLVKLSKQSGELFIVHKNRHGPTDIPVDLQIDKSII